MAHVGRPTKLTPELTAEIVKKISAGCFSVVAAEASGIGRTTFMTWMQRGRKKSSKKIYRDFRDKVDVARATARGDAERRVFAERPYEWLRSGPGREDWGDKAELNIGFNPDQPLNVKHEQPAPAITFAQAITMIGLMGLEMDPEKIKAAESAEQGDMIERPT